MSQIISFSGYTPAPRFDAVPWSHVIIEEATTSEGPWTQIDTIDLSPLDADPSQPAARNITTENATDSPNLWYRLTFTDSSNGIGQPSAPVQNLDIADGAFATANDFANRLGVTLTANEKTRADALLALASDLIVEETGQNIVLATDDVYTAPSVYGDRLRLPQRPIASVSSVVMTPKGGSPETIDPASYFLQGGELVRSRFPLGYELVFQQYGQGWLGPWWTIEVTYTHGYATIPSVVKSVCMEVAIRAWVNPGSVAREQVGDTMTVYDNNRFSPSGLLLTEVEKARLNDFLLGFNAGTVALR